MNKLLVLIIVLFVVGWVMYDSWQPTGNENEIKSSVEVIIDTKQDIIVVDTPLKDMTISSPFVVSGKARGYWFFEASFPISIVNWDGLIIGQGIIELLFIKMLLVHGIMEKGWVNN